jgi:hypothetical protein
MAHLTEHDVTDLKKKYNLDTFFETGTGNGEGVIHAKECGFNNIHTVDCMQETADQAKSNHPWAKVHLGHSPDVVCAFQTMRKAGDPCRVLWWLDAHFPGVDTGILNWQESGESVDCLPLADELDAIVSGPRENDVILIDDAFLYRAGILDRPASDRVPDWATSGLGSLEPWLDRLLSTHTLTIKSEGTGSFVLTPKHLPL